jgi:hypothetical protein
VRGFQSLAIDRAQYCFQHPFSVCKYIVVPETQNEITHGFQDLRSIAIALGRLIVLPTIDLNDELCFKAQKINDKVVDRYLSLEFPSGKSTIS